MTSPLSGGGGCCCGSEEPPPEQCSGESVATTDPFIERLWERRCTDSDTAPLSIPTPYSPPTPTGRRPRQNVRGAWVGKDDLRVVEFPVAKKWFADPQILRSYGRPPDGSTRQNIQTLQSAMNHGQHTFRNFQDCTLAAGVRAQVVDVCDYLLPRGRVRPSPPVLLPFTPLSLLIPTVTGAHIVPGHNPLRRPRNRPSAPSRAPRQQ